MKKRRAKDSDSDKIAAARKAAEELSQEYDSPRSLEADLDILASALRNLPREITGLAEDAEEAFGLCEVLSRLSDADLLSDTVVTSCGELEELTDLADYDMGDPEKFAARAEGHITDLQSELEKLFDKLEAKVSKQQN